MAGFPKSIEAVSLPGGLWLRVKVLTMPEALKSQHGLAAAVSVAVQAAGPDPETMPEGPLAGQPVAVVLKTAEVMGGVARLAVIGHAWSEEEPREWLPCTIVANPQDESPEWHCYAIATIDQIAPGWVFQVGGIALRAAFAAQGEVRPLSSTAT